jgi:hypothetical protein
VGVAAHEKQFPSLPEIGVRKCGPFSFSLLGRRDFDMRILIPSGAMQTTGAFASIATGTSIKTLLQVQASATLPLKVVEWGISFDGSSAATPGKVELIETDVAATVTASAAADLTKCDGEALMAGNLTTNLIQVGTTGTGYGASGEGSVAAVRNLDGPQFIAPTNQFIKQFPLGDYRMVQVGKFLRIRVTFGSTVNAYAYVVVEL